MAATLGDVYVQSKDSPIKMHNEYYVVCKVNAKSIRLAPIVSPTNKYTTGISFNVKQAKDGAYYMLMHQGIYYKTGPPSRLYFEGVKV
jgi:hypothetical protein